MKRLTEFRRESWQTTLRNVAGVTVLSTSLLVSCAVQESSRTKSRGETLELKSITAPECGNWGTKTAMRPRIVKMTDMSCPGSVGERQKPVTVNYSKETLDLADCAADPLLRVAEASCMMSGGRMPADRWSKVNDSCALQDSVSDGMHRLVRVGSQEWRNHCDFPEQPATCERIDGMEEDPTRPPEPIVGDNGSIYRTCSVYKTTAELATFAPEVEHRLRSNMQELVNTALQLTFSLGERKMSQCLLTRLEVGGDFNALAARQKTVYQGLFFDDYTAASADDCKGFVTLSAISLAMHERVESLGCVSASSESTTPSGPSTISALAHCRANERIALLATQTSQDVETAKKVYEVYSQLPTHSGPLESLYQFVTRQGL